MARQAIAAGFPFPAYVNETATRQAIGPGVYVDERSSLFVVVAECAARMESAASIRADNAALAERQGRLAADASGAVDWGAALRADIAARLEGSAALAGLAASRVESPTAVSAERPTPVEWSGALLITLDAGVRVDWMANLSAGATIRLDSGAAIKGESRAMIEIPILTFADAAALLDWVLSARRRRMAIFMRGRRGA